MKKYSRILIIANLILLLGYFNWSVYKKEQTLKDGQLILLQLAPVDPRSLMQGDYMRLSYKEASSDLLDQQTVNDNELVIKYKIVRHRIFLGAESFFFEEGQDTLYQKAVYGGLKVDGKGQSLLVGLYDENFHYIQSDK